MVRTKNNQKYSVGDTITWSKDDLDSSTKPVQTAKSKKTKSSTSTPLLTKRAIKNYIVAGALTLGSIYGPSNMEAKSNSISDMISDIFNYSSESTSENGTISDIEIKKLQFVNELEKEERRVTLDSVVKNLKNEPLKNVFLWDSTIVKLEEKYNIQQGLLAGLIMRESYANPLKLNSGSDGGAGLGMFQPGTGKAYDLKVHGTSNKTGRDTRHGKSLKQLVKETDTTYSKIKEVDERFDIEKSMEATAKYLVDNKKRFGTWSRAISAYNAGRPTSNYMHTRHNKGTRKYQRDYLVKKQKDGDCVDEKLLGELYSITK